MDRSLDETPSNDAPFPTPYGSASFPSVRGHINAQSMSFSNRGPETTAFDPGVDAIALQDGRRLASRQLKSSLEPNSGQDVQMRLLQDRVNSHEGVITSLWDKIHDLAKQVQALQADQNNSEASSMHVRNASEGISHPHEVDVSESVPAEAPSSAVPPQDSKDEPTSLQSLGGSLTDLYADSNNRLSPYPLAMEGPRAQDETSDAGPTTKTRKRERSSDATSHARHETTSQASALPPKPRQRLKASAKDKGGSSESPFLKQDPNLLYLKAFTWLNVRVPRLGREFGIAASLVEPSGNGQHSERLPGNRMTQAMYNSICASQQLGVQVEHLPPESRSDGYKMCALQVRFSKAVGAPPIHRRMVFAIVPDGKGMTRDVELVRCDREEGLPDATFAYSYFQPESGWPRIVALADAYKGRQALAQGRLAEGRATGYGCIASKPRANTYLQQEARSGNRRSTPRARPQASSSGDVARPAKMQRRDASSC